MWWRYANTHEGAHPHGSPPVEHPNQVGDDSPPHLFRVEGPPLPSVRVESAPHGEGLPLPELEGPTWLPKNHIAVKWYGVGTTLVGALSDRRSRGSRRMKRPIEKRFR